METIIDTVGMPGLITAGVFVGLVWIVTIILFLIRPRIANRSPDVDETTEFELRRPTNIGPMFAVIGSQGGRSPNERKQRRSRKSKRV